MLLTYQKESVHPLLAIRPLLAIQSLASIHQPSSTPSFAWKVNPIRLISKISTFMPSNDY